MNSDKQAVMYRQATQADYYIGSVHGITENGEIVIASPTSSQLPAFAITSQNVIGVAGSHKIVSNPETAPRRVREDVCTKEDQQMKQLDDPQSISLIGKILIFERESPLVQ
jgi:hypothetical protein